MRCLQRVSKDNACVVSITKKMKNTILFSIALLLSVAAASCGPQGAEPAQESAGPEESHEYIMLSPAQFRQAGIETGSFTYRVMQEYIAASAELFLSREHTASVSTFTEGIVSELRVSLNQAVRKGDVIAVLSKPALLDLQQEYLELKDRIVFLRAEYERYQALSSENATAAKNFQKAEMELRQAETALALQAAKLRQFQVDPQAVRADNLKTSILLRAPIGGRVTQLHAGVGASMAPGMSLCDIADFSQIRPVVYIFEKDIARVKPGAKVLLHFASDPSRTFSATITGMEGAMDMERKALRAFARFDQTPGSGLVAGAYMEARIAPTAGSEMAVLPVVAVVREGDGEYIFILQREETEGYIFHKAAVRTGATDGGYVAVFPLETLPAEAKIVLKGAYYVSAQGSDIEVED